MTDTKLHHQCSLTCSGYKHAYKEGAADAKTRYRVLMAEYDLIKFEESRLRMVVNDLEKMLKFFVTEFEVGDECYKSNFKCDFKVDEFGKCPCRIKQELNTNIFLKGLGI